MRKLIIAGNWKMNKTISEAVDLAKQINSSEKVDVIVAPPYTSLKAVADTGIKTAAQNMHYEEEGAFTGEISPKMVKELCDYVVLGHSERRHKFMEDDAIINEKVRSALSIGLKVIFCVGETLEERKAGKTEELLEKQITEGLKGVENLDNVIIAYEPVWAIGTGQTASPEQADEVHKFMRAKLKEIYTEESANNVRILYGGSMKPENAKELLSLEDVDGGLIGGASLKAESFNDLIKIAEEI